MKFGPKWGTWPCSLTALRWGSLIAPLIIGLAWAVVTYNDSVRQTLQRATENVGLIHQYTEKLVLTQTLVHKAAEQRAQVQGPDFLRSRTFHEFLAGMSQSPQSSLGVLVLTFDGEVVASSRAFPVSVRIGARPFFSAIRNGAKVFIDRVNIEPDNIDAIVFASPFRVDGFNGVIVSGVAEWTVRQFLGGIATNPNEAASLMSTSGKLLVRNFTSHPLQLPPSAAVIDAMKTRDDGWLELVANVDGVRRIYAFSVMRPLNLAANFGVPIAAMWWQWVMRNGPVQGMLLAIGAFGFILSGKVKSDIETQQARMEAEISQRRREEAETLADQRHRLMQELNHRVKNSLALVESLIGMQMRKQEIVDGQELRARVHAISEVHDLLYKASSAFHVDVGHLLQQICLSPAIVPDERCVDMQLSVEGEVCLNANRATPLALIVVELLTNAVKHAFPPHKTGTIAVSLGIEDDLAVLRISDDGVGMPLEPERNSGLAMVRAFARQIDAQLMHETRPSGGTQFELRFTQDDPDDAAPSVPIQ